MNKIFLVFILIVSASAMSEVEYDKRNPDHKLDNYCVGVLSFARDLLFNDVQIVGGKVWMYSIEPTADVIKVRLALTDLQNTLILRYEYSKYFNDQYRSHAQKVRQKALVQGADYLKNELDICKKRG